MDRSSRRCCARRPRRRRSVRGCRLGRKEARVGPLELVGDVLIEAAIEDPKLFFAFGTAQRAELISEAPLVFERLLVTLAVVLEVRMEIRDDRWRIAGQPFERLRL